MDRQEQLNDIVRGSLYTEVRELSDGRSIVMDPETEHLYYRKRLTVYSVPVFRFLKEHQHKNLPEIHLFWQEEGDLIVIEELIQGKTLEELSDPDFNEKKRILLELCDALEALHSADPPIIHRDIKASNVMIREDGTVKLIDYDAAKQYVSKKSKDTVLIGTQGIAAPEQYGFGQSDARTDIYAMGKLVERLLPESQQAQRIVEKATKLQPELRYRDITELRHQIERLWDPAISASEHRKEVVKEKLRNRKTKRILLAVAVLILLVAGGIWFKNTLYPELFVKKPAYNKGLELMASGEYEEAKKQFEICGTDYRDVEDQLKTCELELEEQRKAEHLREIRDQYETAAATAVEKWRSMKLTGNELDALKACMEVCRQGLDSGETLEAFCDEILEESLKLLKEGKTVLAKDMILQIKKQLGTDQRFAEMADEKQTTLLKALEEREEYGEIADYYDSLPEGMKKDYEEQIKENQYLQGIVWKKNEHYEKAAEQFLQLYDYKDSETQKKECNYLNGKKLIREGKYKEAVTQLNRADDYPGTAELINQAKYEYCQAKADEPDQTARNYLEDLREVGYSGIDDLKRQVETWKIDFVVEEKNSYEVSVKLTFHGGTADGSKGFRAVAHLRDGSTVTHISSLTIKSGTTETLSLKTTNGGTYRNLNQIDIYDMNGNLLGKYTK